MSGIWLFLSNMLYYTWGFIVARYSKGKEIKELVKEKEDLQKRFNCLMEAHKICDEEEQEKQERIDKAIEYIKNNTLYSEEYDYDDEDNLQFQGAYDYKASEDLLNILQGEKNE